MALSNVFIPNDYSMYVNSIGDNTHRVDNIYVDNINGSPYPGGGIPVAVANKVLRTDNSSVVEWGDITTGLITGGSNNQFIGKRTGTVQFTNILPSDTTGGTLNQVLQSDGTNGVFNTNVTLPGTLNVTSTTTLPDTNITGNLQLAGVSGSSGQYLKKTGASTQAFADISGSDVIGGTLNQVLQSDGTKGIFNTNITLPGTLNVTSTTTLPATNITGNLQLNSASGSTGQYIKKTSPSTQGYSNIVAGDIAAGTNNYFIATRSGASTYSQIQAADIAGTGAIHDQVLVRNAANTASVFSDNLKLNGTLFVTGTSLLNGVVTCLTDVHVQGTTTIDTNLSVGNINLGTSDTVTFAGPLILQDEFNVTGSPGNIGDILYSNGAASPPYWDILSPISYVAKYYDNSIVNMNGGSTVSLFASASVEIPTSNVDYVAGAFTLRHAGSYSVIVNLRCSTMQFQTQVNILLNGSYKGSTLSPYNGSTTNPQSFILNKTINANANDILTVISEPIVAGTVNTVGNDNHGISTSDISIIFLGV